MPISKIGKRLVVNANPILSSLLGGNATRIFLGLPVEEFATTQHTLAEVKRYIPDLSQKLRAKGVEVTEGELFLALLTLPIKVYPRSFYRESLREAKARIAKRDPHDVDLLALALALGAPIWSNDEDFKVAGIEVFTTAELLTFLQGRGQG